MLGGERARDLMSTQATSEVSSTASAISDVHYPAGLKIPLSIVFIVQVLIVAGAFAGVVVVLSERQRRDFEHALHDQLAQQQGNAMDSIIGPLMAKSKGFRTKLSAFWNFHGVNNSQSGASRVVYHKPLPPSDNSALEDALLFYQSFYTLPQEDPMIRMVAWINESAVERVDDGGLRKKTWAMFLVDRTKLAVVTNEELSACLGPHPQALDTSSCPKVMLPFNTVEVLGDPEEWPVENIGRISASWSHPGLIMDPVIYARTLSVTYLTTIDSLPTSRPYSAAILIFSLSHIKPIVVNSTASSRSRAALFSNFYDSSYIRHGQYLVTGVLSFPDSIEEETGSYASSWRAGETPDSVLNQAFVKAKFLCYPIEADDFEQGENYKPNNERSANATRSNRTYAFYNYNRCPTPVVFGMSIDGRQYTVSATRALDFDTHFDWMLVQYTPREVFFEASDRARLAGILIGVVGALAILLSCTLVWLSVRGPLLKLQKNMNLAAMMRNDEVAQLQPVLEEMGELVAAFNQMNARLLAARPFLPHTTLLAQQEIGRMRSRVGSISMMTVRSDRKLFGGMDSEGNSERNSESDDECVAEGARANRDGNSNPSIGNEISYIEPTPAKHVVRLLTVDKSLSGMLSSSDSAVRVHAVAFRLPGYEKRMHAKKEYLSPGEGAPSPPLHLPSPQQIFNLFAVNLELRRIAILAINVRGFHHYSSMGTTSEHFLRVHTALSRLVETIVRGERGVVDYFHGDHFVCGFNTVKHAVCVQPALSAAIAAARIFDGFNENELLSQSLPKGLAMGMSVGKAEVGNHGTETMQRLGMMGTVFGEAVKLQEIMSRRVLGGAGRVWRQVPNEKKRAQRRGAVERHSAKLLRGNRELKVASDQDRQGYSDEDKHARLIGQMEAKVAGRCLVLGRTVQEVGGSINYQLLGAIDASYLLPSVDSVRRSVRVDCASSRNNLLAHVVFNNVAGLRLKSDTNFARKEFIPMAQRGAASALASRVLIAAIVSARRTVETRGAPGRDGWLYGTEATEPISNPFDRANLSICKLFAEGSVRTGLSYFSPREPSKRATVTRWRGQEEASHREAQFETGFASRHANISTEQRLRVSEMIGGSKMIAVNKSRYDTMRNVDFRSIQSDSVETTHQNESNITLGVSDVRCDFPYTLPLQVAPPSPCQEKDETFWTEPRQIDTQADQATEKWHSYIESAFSLLDPLKVADFLTY